jgi:integrase
MAYKMKSGRYRAERVISGVRKTATFDTKKEARAWEAEQNSVAWEKQSKRIVTVLYAANEYLDEVASRMVPRTVTEKKQAFGHLLKFIGSHENIESITPQLAARSMNEQYQKRGGNAANGDRKNLVAWWNWCAKRLGVERENPFSKLDKFPEDKHARVVPKEEYMQRLLDGESGETRTLLLAALHTAARRGELLSLRWDDLDMERRSVRLWTRKRKGGGMDFNLIPMTEELHDALAEHKRSARSVFVFCQADGQQITDNTIRKFMARLCKKHDVPKFGFHGIRHLSASMLDAAGVGLSVIQMILRHKSATTTDGYLHSLRGVQVDLDGVFGKKKKAHKSELVSLHG